MRANPFPLKPDGILYSDPVPEEVQEQIREKLAAQTFEEWLTETEKGKPKAGPGGR
jgi:hypothetical protein